MPQIVLLKSNMVFLMKSDSIIDPKNKINIFFKKHVSGRVFLNSKRPEAFYTTILDQLACYEL